MALLATAIETELENRGIHCTHEALAMGVDVASTETLYAWEIVR